MHMHYRILIHATPIQTFLNLILLASVVIYLKKILTVVNKIEDAIQKTSPPW